MATLPLHRRDTSLSTASKSNTMNIFKRLSTKKASSSKDSSYLQSSLPAPPRHNMANTTPFTTTTPTRRPRTNDEPPPAYSPPAQSITVPAFPNVNEDSPYAFLRQFDTIFLIDDSGSMAGRSWRETSEALSAITPICTTYDADGIDIYFLNHRNPINTSKLGAYTNVTTTDGVRTIFNSVRPLGGTPTGTRLNQILKPYLAEVENSIERQAHGHDATIKPLNIIVITDGVPNDDVESVIVSAARRLDSYGAEPWQVGIQFFQVGCEPEAAEDLRELDDALSGAHNVRDMVDTVPWSGDNGQTLTADFLLKVVLGSVVRRWDRKAAKTERQQNT